MVIGGTTFEWSYGKTFIIKANVKYSISPISIPIRMFRLAFERKKTERFEPKK